MSSTDEKVETILPCDDFTGLDDKDCERSEGNDFTLSINAVETVITCEDNDTEKRPFVCQICSTSFTRQSDLQRHCRVHSEDRPYACSRCKMSFYRKDNLERHSKSHLGQESPKPESDIPPKLLKCSICVKYFDYFSVYQRHLRTHSNDKPFKCDVCNKSFFRGSDLKRHMNIHTQEVTFDCELCDRKFSRKDNLSSHLLTHTKDPSMPNCKLCSCSATETPDPQCPIHKCNDPVVDPEISEKVITLKKICSICRKSFLDEMDLVRHLRKHAGGKSYMCGLCKKSFNKKCGLQRHFGTHVEEGLYYCETCMNDFPDELSLTEHVCSETEINKLNCKICLDTFTNEFDFSEHVCEAGTSSNRHHFMSQQDSNFLSFKNEDSNTCFGSDENSAATSASIHSSTMDSRSIESSLFDSTSDGSSFMDVESRENLRNISESHQNSELKKESVSVCLDSVVETNKLFCKLCSSSFKNETNLSEHDCPLKSQETIKCNSEIKEETVSFCPDLSLETTQVVCKTCCSCFENDAKLSEHDCPLKSQETIKCKEKIFFCDKCERSYTQEEYMSHICTQTGEEPDKCLESISADFEGKLCCEVCMMCFSCKDKFLDHIRVHTALHICPVCNKSFRRRDTLISHKKIHQTEKVICYLCEKPFSRKTHLDDHLRIVHEKQKLFACKVCDKRFDSKSHMKRHTLIHTGEKPHICDICKKTFSRKDNFQAHRQTHIAEKVEILLP